VTGCDPSQLPVEQLAHVLLNRARVEPALQCRSPANSNAALPFDATEPVQVTEPPSPPDPMADLPALLELLRGDPPADDSLRIAIASVRHAEEASWQASQASRAARRGIVIATAFGVVGVMIGVAAIADSRFFHHAGPQLAAVSSELRAIGDAQRQIDDQLSALHADAVARAAVVTPQVQSPAQPAPSEPLPATANEAPMHQQVAATAVPPASYPPPIRYRAPLPAGYNAPPPPYTPPPRHYRTARYRTPIIAMVVDGFRRDVRALFR